MNGTNYEVPHCGAFSTPNSHPSWAQIFASGSCFQIPLAWIPPLNKPDIIPNYSTTSDGPKVTDSDYRSKGPGSEFSTSKNFKNYTLYLKINNNRSGKLTRNWKKEELKEIYGRREAKKDSERF